MPRCWVGCVRGRPVGFRSGNLVLTKSQSLYTEAQSRIPRALFFFLLLSSVLLLQSTNLLFQKKDTDGNDQKHQHVALRIQSLKDMFSELLCL